ncbi:barstar family protein [Zavarzinella formosa]|uniref:barstar family protein n=1 Tax=Zavarzinella formosa TaxID=360055 RepID=UPI00030D1819|nr:barstar family protein [Zavarzinella formosa]
MSSFRTDPTNPHCVHPDDVLRMDRLLLLNSPVALYGPSERLRRHIAALESYGYRCPAFDCGEWASEADMHRALATGLEFPAYYGHNLDALNDCLGDLDVPEAGGVALVLWRFDRFARLLAVRTWDVLDVIASASWVHRLYGRRLLGLIQSDDPDLHFPPVGARPVMWVSWECHKQAEPGAAADCGNGDGWPGCQVASVAAADELGRSASGERMTTMAGNRPVHQASFKFRGTRFLHDWNAYRKALKLRRSDRPMRDTDGPPWERIDGRGFTIWVSEICSANRRTESPAWEIRMESLALLNPEGQQCWSEACEGIERFIRASGLERVEDSTVTVQQIGTEGPDSEPSAVPNPAALPPTSQT